MSDKKSIATRCLKNLQHTEKQQHFGKHTITDYPEAFRTVEIEAELRQRHYEVEIEPDLVQILQMQAQSRGVTISHLVSSLLRQHLPPATV